MKRDALIAVAAGVLGALLLVAAWRGSFLGVTLGMMFSPMPLAMATLGLGLRFLPVSVLAGAMAVTALTGSLALAALYAVVDVAPIAILMRIEVAAQKGAAIEPPPTPAYRTIAVPGWYVGMFWVAALAAWLMPGNAGYVVANAVAALSLPLVLQGLAVVHVAIASFGYGRIALVAFYLTALVVAVHPRFGAEFTVAGAALALVVMLGMMDQFFQLRARLASRRRNGGE